MVKIAATNLTKQFDQFVAVDQVSFSVNQGEIYGLLGPNGAGKTTILRMLSGLLRPNHGKVEITGISMRAHKVKARTKLGFLTGEMDLYRRLTPRELLHYFGELFEVPSNMLSDRVEHLIEIFGIIPFADKHCEKLSTGQKQRVSIARTQIHDPEVVILDEPTTGLDIMASEFILEFIRNIVREDGKTVIFSTHNLTEVERLCDRIGILNEGKLIFNGDQKTLLESVKCKNLSDAFFYLVNEEQ